MDDAGGEDAHGRRGHSRSRENGVNGYGPADGGGSVPQTPRLSRYDSDMSSASIFEDVEMAHDEVGFQSRKTTLVYVVFGKRSPS